ncbi:glycosyltransferase [Desulfobaculum xiamenense]|nr:glycosyltransferase [Desulfobaculum xiamenense]
MRRICVVNMGDLAREFETMGFEVLNLALEPGVHDVSAILDERGFVPDLLVEVESLGPRTILAGLENLHCVRLFWSIDTHLNSWWQRHYGRLFDAVLTTQGHWVRRLEEMGVPAAHWLPWFGTERPFVPWDEREHDMGFIGRLTGFRPLRKRLVDFLSERYGLAHFDNVPFARLLETYERFRIVPNESILSEVNFRLFEGASAGCLVVNQQVGCDVGQLFVPGREILVYSDILELDELVRRTLARRDEAQAMARAAWERVRREHLLSHRAASILSIASEAAGRAASGAEARTAFVRTLAILREAEFIICNDAKLLAMLDALSADPELLARALRLRTIIDRRDEVRSACVGILDAAAHRESFDVNFAGSMCMLACGEWDMAKSFWYRQVDACGAKWCKPESPRDLHLAWSRECVRRGALYRPGLRYDVVEGLPEAALESLIAADSAAPGDMEVKSRMETVLSRLEGVDELRLGVLSELSLHAPDNWRIGLELGLVNLRAMRLEAGLEELRLALDIAVGQGKETMFMRALAARDISGRTARFLKLGRLMSGASASL